LTIEATMHVEEACVVYSHEDDEAIEITLMREIEPSETEDSTIPLAARPQAALRAEASSSEGSYMVECP
jgi:hypothetical protein